MNEDPIVAEVRRIREKRASRFGYDIHKIFADLIARAGTPGIRHIRSSRTPANGPKPPQRKLR